MSEGKILTKTAENQYTATIGIDDINLNKTDTIRVNVTWENDISETNDEKDSVLGQKLDTTINIPVQVKVTQYLGEEIIPY